MHLLEKYAEFLALVGLYFLREGLKWYKQKRITKKLEDGKNNKLNITSDIRRKIQEELIKIQVYVGCNRVSIFEYSNGTRTLNDISLQFINMTYEVPDDTTAPIINRFQLIAISPYLDKIKLIDQTPGFVKETATDGTQVEQRLRRSWNTHTSYSFKISNSIWDGFLSLMNVSTPLELTNEEIEYVQIHIMYIRELMIKLQKQ